MSKYHSPSLYYSCGCGRGKSRQDSYDRKDVQSYRRSKCESYSDDRRKNDYYEYFYDGLRPCSSRNRCNCPYCREKRKRRERRFVCRCWEIDD
ncbi:MAG: hypothetical protein GX374_07810 [Bacilli bacterium]|nr:hypothetical protein [Bacilli bacterium]